MEVGAIGAQDTGPRINYTQGTSKEYHFAYLLAAAIQASQIKKEEKKDGHGLR